MSLQLVMLLEVVCSWKQQLQFRFQRAEEAVPTYCKPRDRDVAMLGGHLGPVRRTLPQAGPMTGLAWPRALLRPQAHGGVSRV